MNWFSLIFVYGEPISLFLLGTYAFICNEGFYTARTENRRRKTRPGDLDLHHLNRTFALNMATLGVVQHVAFSSSRWKWTLWTTAIADCLHLYVALTHPRSDERLTMRLTNCALIIVLLMMRVYYIVASVYS
jgi:hypothetical protein